LNEIAQEVLKFSQQHTHYAALIAITVAWFLFGLITRIPLMHKAVRIFLPWRAHVGIEYNNNYGIFKKRGWTVVIGNTVVYQFERYLVWALIKSLCKYLKWPMENKMKV
jgi:hypothetical protein